MGELFSTDGEFMSTDGIYQGLMSIYLGLLLTDGIITYAVEDTHPYGSHPFIMG